MAPEKCSYIIFSKNKKTQNQEWINLKLGDKNIPNESIEGVKFLGITLDRYLSFDKHVYSLKSKSINSINILKNLSCKKYKLDVNTLLLLYKSIVRSILDFFLFFDLELFFYISNKNFIEIAKIESI